MPVQVKGPGHALCDKVEKIVWEIAAESGADVAVEKVTDFREMVSAGVFGKQPGTGH